MKKRNLPVSAGFPYMKRLYKAAALCLVPVLGLVTPACSVSALADEVRTDVTGDNALPNAEDMNIPPDSEGFNTPDPDITDADGNLLNEGASATSGTDNAGYADITSEEADNAGSAELEDDEEEEPSSVETYDVNNKTAKIHFLTLDASTEAILLECNGHFAMVDSGEDTTYPDGSDSRYPDRDGITKGMGFEDQVIKYLKSVGVNEDNFDFYIGTHAHSDHIGTAPQIIETFKPDRVYIPEYKDSYIDNTTNLWDNLYCYDRMLTAAQDVGASIILGFDPAQPIYPDRVDIDGTLTWEDNQNSGGTRPSSLNVSVTSSLTGETASVSAMPDSGSSNTWSFSLPNMQKYDDNKNAISYTVTVSAPDGYTAAQTGSYQFTLTSSSAVSEDPTDSGDVDPAAAETFLSGIVDSQNDGGEEGTSDDMETTDIPEEDLVDPTNEADPANAALYSAGSAGPRVGKFDNISEEQNTVASPNFTLGGDMKIEIKHYGSDYKKTTTSDANNFSIGVLVTVNGKKAFLSGDINNYQGAETALASSVGKVDIMTLGHHGYYGSNTSTYMNALDPAYMLLCGQAIGLHSGGMSDDSAHKSTLTILEERSNAGSRLYPTGWYSEKTDALVFTLNKRGISTSIPYGLRGIAVYSMPSAQQNRAMYYNGLLNTYTGWYTNKYGYRAYYNNSIYNVKNTWLANSGKWYYLNSTGGLAVGWQYLSWSGGKSWFFFDSSGAMLTGWQYLSWGGGRNWFFFDSSGAMKTGWQYLSWSGGKSWFYFNGSGAMLTGWQYLPWSGGRNWFYFNESGAMLTGWQYLPWGSGRNWFYFNGSGAMLTGWQRITWGGQPRWFYFNGSGAMATGWVKLGNTWYYLDPSTGVMLTGTHTINGKRYRFNASGALM